MLLKKKLFNALILTASFTASVYCYGSPRDDTAPVTGYARSFPLSYALANAKISILETGQQVKTDANGNFGPIMYPVGRHITLTFEKTGYKTIQSATMVVPPQGLTGPQGEVTFQVPAIETYYLIAAVIGAPIHEEDCHLTATIAAYKKTLNDDKQGEEGATVTIMPKVDAQPFYFDIFKSGPFKDKTNPFTRGLTSVSQDGGVALFNLPPRVEPYTISAYKAGKIFSEAKFICQKGAFINISPPHGPTVQNQE